MQFIIAIKQFYHNRLPIASPTIPNFGNTESLANSIVELLVNEKKRKKMGLRAAERIRQFFDAELNAEQTVELYSELLKRNTKPLP